ncbi:formimidoylglutamase [Gramella sp. AN32]|uniref:Formimidoylglutamase n=1 Tax=Christiangramia antarctica TaxID=2058158 RepID=A0ABW5X5W0_9FLAO|nr:formimidoylglutamase [Gramella sp. AN32]MCM4154479.1 formimidoylglutamase [Gramella sp. AN32]
MEGLKIYTKRNIDHLISDRKGETKFGEKLSFVESIEDLKKEPAAYVLLGIPEDIGIRANYGNAGAANTWKIALQSLVNLQQNRFNSGENLILLGEIDCAEFNNKAGNLDKKDPNYYQKLGDLVKQIDQILTEVIEKINEVGKIPIIIGGGHNNAYGNIKGASKALENPINVLNIDAHSDLRTLEHRHSGNAFSYAIAGGFLNKYYVFGLQKNYTPEYIFEEMDFSENLNYMLFEGLNKSSNKITRAFREFLKPLSSGNFGFELDCDVIANFNSSAMSPSGFSVDQIRGFISEVKKEKNCCYFHICEAIPDKKNSVLTGKAISYFISDFIRK